MTTAPAIEPRTFTTLDTVRGDLLDVYAAVRAPLLHLPNSAVTASIDVLDSVPEDIHTVVWEIPPENLGEGGRQPEPASVTNNISMLLSRGRSPEVLLALLTRFTDVTQDVLGVERRHVHVVLHELPREHIGEMGVPMAAPGDPRWFTGGSAAVPRTPLPAAGDASPVAGLA